jgi:hypothetical protein
MPQLALHRFECVVDDFVERFVRAVVLLFLVGYQLVPARDGHIDTDPKLVSFMMRVVRLLDGHVAAIDVVAESLEPRCVIENEIVDLVGFLQAPVSDLNWQLHNWFEKSLILHVDPARTKNNACHPEPCGFAQARLREGPRPSKFCDTQ